MDVAPDSQTETYAAARVYIDNWRWAGVPFYLRTGKRLTSRRTEISVQLKAVPFLLFRDTPVDSLVPNVLTLRIDPEHGTTFDFNVKVPGPVMQVGAVQSSFKYGDFFAEKANVGYETLLYDCMLGDETLFQRADSIESSWAAVEAVLHPEGGPLPVHGYEAGSAGPKESDDTAEGRWSRMAPAWRSIHTAERRSQRQKVRGHSEWSAAKRSSASTPANANDRERPHSSLERTDSCHRCGRDRPESGDYRRAREDGNGATQGANAPSVHARVARGYAGEAGGSR